MRDAYWHNMARRIQRAWRGYLRYRNECASKIQRFWMNKKEGIQYIRLRDAGHQVLAQRKERRRYSLVSMRQFRGDYLGVGGKAPFGQALRSVCTMGGNESVAFSMRCEVLVSKLGRSSKPSPRFLILVRSRVLTVQCCTESRARIRRLMELSTYLYRNW
jgi:myosin-1